jgi:hypothetical protein
MASGALDPVNNPQGCGERKAGRVREAGANPVTTQGARDCVGQPRAKPVSGSAERRIEFLAASDAAASIGR